MLSKAERRAKQEAQRAAKQSSGSTASKAPGDGKKTLAGKGGHQEKGGHSSHVAPPGSATGKGHKATPSTSAPAQSQSAASPTASTSASVPGTPHLQLLSHLTAPPLHLKTKHDSLIHPSIARLALNWSNLSIVGTNARCISMLAAFQDMLHSYTCPEGSILARHLPTTYLSPQIECLYRARMRSLTLGNAIRWFKAQIAECRDMSEIEAKDYLITGIDSFIRERIVLADHIIVKLALDKITDGHTVLTYGRSAHNAPSPQCHL